MGNPQLEQKLGNIIHQFVSSSLTDQLKEREVVPFVSSASRASTYARLSSAPFQAPGPAVPVTGDGFADVEWLAQVLGRSVTATYDLIRYGYIPEQCLWRIGKQRFRIRPLVVLQWRRYGLPGHPPQVTEGGGHDEI